MFSVDELTRSKVVLNIYRVKQVTEYLDDVLHAIAVRDAQMGTEPLPDGTGSKEHRRQWHKACDRTRRDSMHGRLTYEQLLKEHMFYVLEAPPHSDELSERLTQMAALCVSWIRKIHDPET